jgi:superoxide reductase
MKFYRCAKCGKIIEIVKDTGVPTICCGEEMKELIPGTSDGASEKHVPVISVSGNKVTVTVGSVEHPMLPEHYIEWIILETDKGVQKKTLQPGQKPAAEFVLSEGEKVLAAYEYCNLHRLWKCSFE